jgi:D-sedoheptulose 7-phosphate isomerase
MNILNIIDENIKESIDAKKKLLSNKEILSAIEDASLKCSQTIIQGQKILIAGNGGSASDSQHFAAEIVGRYEVNRAAKPAIALTTDTSNITAIANDFGYKYIFSRQLEAIGAEQDVYIAISTSGNSENIIESLKTANDMGIKTIGLTGNNGGQMNKLVDTLINVPSERTVRIQEMHIMILHILCNIIEGSITS